MPRASEALNGVDFLDFGSSSGASLEWATNTFGGVGMGIDLSVEKAERAREAGYRMLVGDARKLILPDNCVKYAVIMDFLEHLPSVEDAALVVKAADRVSRDFFVVNLPNFDNEAMLRKKGLKRYYADWSGHSLHLRTSQLLDVLDQLKGESLLYRYGEIYDTWDRSIIPAIAPRNSSFFDPTKFGERKFEVLPRKTFYTRTLAIVVKGGALSPPALLAKCVGSLGIIRELTR